MRLKSGVCLFLLILLPSFARAQTVNVTTGSINGLVTDATGGILPGTTVTATNLETGLTRTAVADGQGTYLVNLLPPGRYRVDAQLSGLGNASATGVEVLLGNATKVDLKITPQVSETVTVTGVAPTVDTTRTGTAVSVTNQQIEDLPLLGRDFRSLASLTPGIVDAFGGRVTANGARGIATDYNIDGATSNNDFFGENTGGTRAPFTFSQAAIQEFQVVRSQYDAEYGRGVGAQVNAITKSGTNRLSGEAFIFRRNRECLFGNSATADNRSARFCTGTRESTLSNGQTVVDSFRSKDSTQGGFAIGGPIAPNKMFFFGNFDSQRQLLPITYTNDIRNSTGFKNLSATQQQQFMTKLETYLGHPYDNELNYDQTFNQNTYLGKFDANLSGRHHLSIRDNYTNFENANNQTIRHFSNQGLEHDKFNQLVGQVSSALNSRMANQLMVEVLRDERPIDPVVPIGPEVSIQGFATGTTATFFGPNDGFPNNTIEKKVQVKDSLQYVQGAHTFKAGTDLLFMNIDNFFARNINGVFAYSSPTNFINNTVNTFSQAYGPSNGHTIWSQNTYAFFASDNVRINKRLTMDVGLRYDWQTMPKPEANAYPQHPEFITQIKVDRNNVAPRLGFAYDLTGDGKSVLRGGTGLFYGYMPDILLNNPLSGISGNFNSVSITCATAKTVTCPAFPALLATDSLGSLVSTSTNVVPIGANYQAQQSWRSSLQFERQLAMGYTVAVSGVFASMKNVQGSRNVNAVPTGITFGNVPVYDVVNANRKYPDLGVVRELCSCETASFKALTFETHRLAIADSRLSWDLSYTLSKAIDEESNERSTSSSFLFDPFNPSLSEGPSDNDVRHRVVGDATYRSPWWGLNVSAIYSWRTGVPYNPGIAFSSSGVSGSPTSLTGLSQTTGNIPIFLDSAGSIIDLTQANGFTRQQLADFLNARGAHIIGRNAYNQPHFHNVDMRISKTVELSRNTRVQFLIEMFNLLNTRNTLVSSNNQDMFKVTQTTTYAITSQPNFGKVDSYSTASDPRQFQVAAKIFF